MSTATALAIPPPQEPTRMPLELKRILHDHDLAQQQWCAAVRQTAGRAAGQPLSATAAHMILNRDTWPKETPRDEIVRQTAEWLRSHGVADAEIAIAFDWDPLDRARNKKPPRSASPRAQARRARAAGAADTTPFLDPLPETAMLSAAARKHFQLFRDPFTDDVQGPDDVFLSHEHRYVREAMFSTAKLGGFLAVIGESGAGKTTLRRDLVDRIRREELPITVIQPRCIDKSRLHASAISDAIIGDVSQEPPARTLEGKARQIERLLTGSSRAGYSHALLIEEAHDLSVQTLKYLKRFWELEDGFRKLLSIILVGQPELRDKLDERQNWEAREVIRRCEVVELAPLNGDLEQYLALKFRRVGERPLEAYLAADACDAIRTRLTLRRRGTDATVSMHYPLVVNNLVVRALNVAAEIGAPKVTADIVLEA